MSLILGGFYGVVEAENLQAKKSMEKLGELEAKKVQEGIDYLNELKRDRERNVRTVLSAISGLASNATTEEFWNWWPNFNENFTSYEKPTTYTTSIDNSNYSTTRTTLLVDVYSCLIAGTQIQTVDGLRSIEDLKIGDVVASLDATTSATSLRPITYLSNRTADATYVLTFPDGNTIRVTGGHYWWVVGKGWQRSRELKAGQFMRTGDSSVEITKVEKIEVPIKVYNMIVDENHTYFVGKDRLLSWDVTALNPTLQTAPGQSQSIYVSKK